MGSQGQQIRRVSLVTGGARGFGQAISQRLARDGHDVAVLDVAPHEETRVLVEQEGARFLGLTVDVTSPEELSAAATTIERELGPVDILVANAGIYPIEPFLETRWETWRRAMDVNADGTFHLFKTFIPGMMERRWGRVIAIISGAFYAPPPGFSAYVASKGAVVGLVRAVAREAGPFGVTVNSVAPPLVETPGVAAGPQRQMGTFDIVFQAQSLKREGRVEDVTGPVSFLASEDGAFVTGQSLLAEGGINFT